MKDKTIGVDLAKNVFEIGISDRPGHVEKTCRLSRAKFLKFFVDQVPSRVVMEACGSSHYWAREIRKLGHEVKLISPQYVRPYGAVKLSNFVSFTPSSATAKSLISRLGLNQFRSQNGRVLLNLIYEGGCQEKQLPDGLAPLHRIVVEAASPMFRYAKTFRQFKNGQCNIVTEFEN